MLSGASPSGDVAASARLRGGDSATRCLPAWAASGSLRGGIRNPESGKPRPGRPPPFLSSPHPLPAFPFFFFFSSFLPNLFIFSTRKRSAQHPRAGSPQSAPEAAVPRAGLSGPPRASRPAAALAEGGPGAFRAESGEPARPAPVPPAGDSGGGTTRVARGLFIVPSALSLPPPTSPASCLRPAGLDGGPGAPGPNAQRPASPFIIDHIL